jgi:hypothetical protein
MKNMSHSRKGWKEQILKEIKKGGYPERLIPENIPEQFAENEWEWEQYDETTNQPETV